MRLLLIEDEEALGRELRRQLAQRGFAVDCSTEGTEGAFMGESESYDAIILDLGLPDMSGLDILTRWRARNIKTPVLILTARGAWHEKVEGFRAGADDYLSKPFHIEELTARLQALVRRAAGQADGTLRIGRLKLDETRQEAAWHEHDGSWRRITLTGIEFRLLRYLMLHPDKLSSSSQLLEHIYDFDDEKESNVIEVYISRLRRKLSRTAIRTRRGQGYFLDTGALRDPLS